MHNSDKSCPVYCCWPQLDGEIQRKTGIIPMTKHDEIKIDDTVEERLIGLKNVLRTCKCSIKIVHSGNNLAQHVINDGSDIVLLASSSEHELQSHIASMLTYKTKMPVILYLFEYDEVAELVGLRTGACDVLNENMSKNVILERIMAVHRRHSCTLGSPLNFRRSNKEEPSAALFVDVDNNELFINNHRVELTTTEIKLVEFLGARRGGVVTREELIALLEKLCGGSVNARSVDSHIKRIRKKIYSEGLRKQLIKTVYGLGYRLAPMH